MSSDKKCCVPGCFEAGASYKVLHVFPNPNKYPDRFEAWRKAVGGKILELSFEHIYKYRRVCRAHFEDKFHCRYDRLSNIAIPTINMAGEQRTVPTQAIASDELRENTPGIELPTGDITQARKRPMTSIENIENVPDCVPSTSKDITQARKRPMAFIENIENVPDCVPSTSKDITQARKRPMASIENIENVPDCVPSTSKDITQARKRPMASIENIENVADCVPSTSKDYMNLKKSVKVKARTLAEIKLNKKLVAAKMKLSKIKNKLKKQATAIKIAKNILTNESLLKAIEGLPRSGKIVTMLQLREVKKQDKGRRFSVEEKLVALSLFKQSPKGYRCLRKMLILPAPQTLTKLLSMANIQPGINKNIFTQLKKQAEKMKPYEKLCVLLFDEMALKSNIAYNERQDKVIGFVDNGENVTKEFADHAQVFMIRGLLKNYKQPIGYTFSASATKGPELAKQIKQYVRHVTEAGLTVVATVCDQGSGNRNAIKCLIDESRATWLRRGEEPKKNLILIEDNEIVPLYDAPHLIKCIRNNLIIKDLIYTQNDKQKVAKWSHIELLYDESPVYQGIRLIPKLSENHVKPAKIGKMKVKYATQLFSQTVGANMGYLADKHVLPMECKDTADVILFFDNLFDSVNGSRTKNRYAKPALGPVTQYSVHHKIWHEAKKVLKTMKFVKENKIENVPTIKNWVWTLDGIEILLHNLFKKHNISSVWMRHLNQDPIENFFGSIRSHGCRNTNPTPEKFQSAFAALLINSLSSVHAPGNNCEDDVATALHPLVISEDSKAKESEEVHFNYEMIAEINFQSIEEKFENTRIKAGLQYCSGYFAKKAKGKVFKKCPQCNKNLIDNKECEYIRYREYERKRWLCSPTPNMILNISQMQDLIHLVLLNNIEMKYLKEFIKTLILISIEFNFIKCDKHKDNLINFLIGTVSRFFIHSYCKNINKILQGSRSFDDEKDVLQIKAKKYFDKCYKRKK